MADVTVAGPQPRKWCSATKRNGTTCEAKPITDPDKLAKYGRSPDDPPLCTMHLKTKEQRKAFSEQGVHARIVRVENEDRLEGLAFGVTPEHINRVCIDLMDAKLVTGEVDHGARFMAAILALNFFPRSLRLTFEDERNLLHGLLDGSRAKKLAEIDLKTAYRHSRREWFETQTRVDSLNRIYAVAVPPMLLGPGETAESVKSEIPSFDDWKVEPLRNERGQEISTHVRVHKPDGTTVLLQRDSFGRERDAG